MLTLPGLLRSTAAVHGHRPAIRGDGGQWTWREYVHRIACTATVLLGLGLRPGQRFGLLGRNAVLQAQLLQAGYWAGIVPVPLNFRLAPGELAELLDDAGCQALFVDEALWPLLASPALARWRAIARPMPLGGPGASAGAGLLQQIAAAAPAPVHEAEEGDDAIVLYTGGTTGRAKGVRLTHRNVVANALQLAQCMAVRPQDVYLHVAPMFHSTDLKATALSLCGGSHVYLPEFSAEAVLAATARHQVSILSLVPTMILRVLEEGRLQAHDLRSLRLISYGTSPIEEGLLRRALAAFEGVGFHQCYGLTETSPLLALLDEHAHRQALQGRPALLRAAGRPLPLVQLRFLDEQGDEAGPGEAGEIVARGPQVSPGYLNRDEDNRTAFRGGWFHTGDIGRLDEEGYLHVLGRRKEMVITGGENVYPREVERVLEQHPAVSEVAVVGVPDARYGEALLAVIVPARGLDQPLSAEALIAFCRAHLGGFKIPRRYRFVQALPRTALGKVRKHALRTQAHDTEICT